MNFAALTYEDYFGLSLNISRMQSRHACAVLDALRAARGYVSSAFYEGVAHTQEQAEDMAYDHNASVDLAKAIAS